MTIDIETLRFETQLNKLDNSQMVLSPLVVSELLNRLEEAEKAWKISDQTVYDLTEKVIPNIQKKFEAAEKELVEIRHGAAVANDTIKALRAQIEAIHSLLDGDESKIIRNAKDGYPEGREPKELTLTERVTALCKYASDWERWFSEAESKIEQMERQEPVAHVWRCDNGHIHGSCESELLMGQQLYALPGAKGEKDV